jgi:hypothetical protein
MPWWTCETPSSNGSFIDLPKTTPLFHNTKPPNAARMAIYEVEEIIICPRLPSAEVLRERAVLK